MKKIIKSTVPVAIAACAMLATGCTKKYYNDCPEGGTGDQQRITLSSEVQFGVSPRIQDEQIVSGQALSLFVTRAGSTLAADQLYQNNRITADGMGGFTYRVPMFYPSNGGNVDLYAVHPYYAASSLSSPHPFEIQTDQTSESNYLNSDLLFGTAANVVPQVNAVALTFYHKLSKLDFTVTTSDPGIDLTQLTAVSVLGTLPQTTVSMTTGAITPATGNATPVVAYNDPETASSSATQVTGYTAIIIPQTAPGAQQLFQLTIGGTERYYTPPANYTFDTGKKYNVTLDVTQSGITVTSQIVDWQNGGSIGGPAGPQ